MGLLRLPQNVEVAARQTLPANAQDPAATVWSEAHHRSLQTSLVNLHGAARARQLAVSLTTEGTIPLPLLSPWLVLLEAAVRVRQGRLLKQGEEGLLGMG